MAELPAGFLEPVPDLRWLDLASNALPRPPVFPALRALQALNLSHNALTLIPDAAFNALQLSPVATLNLAFQRSASDAPLALTANSLLGLGSLAELSLAANRLVALPGAFLTPCAGALERLYLFVRRVVGARSLWPSDSCGVAE